MTKTIFLAIMLIFTGMRAQTKYSGHTASISGKIITDTLTNSPLAGAGVVLYLNDTTWITNVSSDGDGNFHFKNLKAGTYKIKAFYISYANFEMKNIVVKNNKKTDLKILLERSAFILNEIEIKTKQISHCQLSIMPKLTVTSELYDRTFGGSSVKTRGARSHAEKKVKPDFNTEEYNKLNDNEFKDAKQDPLSTMSIDVDKASYSNIRRYISKGNLPPADAVRVEEMINYFTYNYPQPADEKPFSITTEYTECSWNKNHNLIHIGIKGREVNTAKMPANNLVFLVDVSGSMMDENKLPLVKSGLRLLVEQLRDEDRVSLVVYAGAAGIVLPSTPGSNKEKIMAAIDQLEAGGSTAGGQGIVLAYKTAKENFIPDGNNRVILATDGDFNVGVSSDGELIRLIEEKREDDIFLTVLGFGTGNYKDSKMEQLADKGNGNYAYIDDILEAKKVLVKEMGGTLLTIAKDVKIQIEFNPSKVKAYRLVGYENRLLNKEDFNDDKKDAGELGAGHTVTAIYEIIPAGSNEIIAGTDPLKYQQTSPANSAENDEVMTIKFRYKEPKQRKSKLITEILKDKKTELAAASGNCKFSSAVAQFGMLLRDSKFKGDANFKNVIALAKQSQGEDEEGYRAEFIRLVEKAELLKK